MQRYEAYNSNIPKCSKCNDDSGESKDEEEDVLEVLTKKQKKNRRKSAKAKEKVTFSHLRNRSSPTLAISKIRPNGEWRHDERGDSNTKS